MDEDAAPIDERTFQQTMEKLTPKAGLTAGKVDSPTSEQEKFWRTINGMGRGVKNWIKENANTMLGALGGWISTWKAGDGERYGAALMYSMSNPAAQATLRRAITAGEYPAEIGRALEVIWAHKFALTARGYKILTPEGKVCGPAPSNKGDNWADIESQPESRARVIAAQRRLFATRQLESKAEEPADQDPAEPSDLVVETPRAGLSLREVGPNRLGAPVLRSSSLTRQMGARSQEP